MVVVVIVVIASVVGVVVSVVCCFYPASRFSSIRTKEYGFRGILSMIDSAPFYAIV